MSDQMTVIYTAANVRQAHLLKNQLGEAGITACVVNDALQGVAGEVPFGFTNEPVGPDPAHYSANATVSCQLTPPADAGSCPD